MTARRSLMPAARGVSLAVLAALRAGRVDLADQADGSTLATSTAPDGTELLRATLRMPVRGVDTRTSVLPNVNMVPQPAEVPPAPVAVPAGEERGAETLCSVWVPRDQWLRVSPADCDFLYEPVDGSWIAWTLYPTDAPVSPWVFAPAPETEVLVELRKLCARLGIALHESAEAPPAPERGAFALAPGDLITLDGARVRVAHVDGEGFTWAEVNRDGFSVGEVERCLWREVDRLGEARWRILPVETETPSQKAKREKAAKRAKAVPARNVPVPEADNLAVYGERSIVAIIHEGGPWELVWSDALPGHMSYEVAVSATTAQAHRVRVYHRGKRCTRDSRDGAK